MTLSEAESYEKSIISTLLGLINDATVPGQVRLNAIEKVLEMVGAVKAAEAAIIGLPK